MQIIGFAGLARAGKTTAANALGKWCVCKGNCLPRMRSFAGPLKKAAAEIGAIKGGDTDALYRRFCQEVGANMRDSSYIRGVTGAEYWVRLMEKNLRADAAEDAAMLENSLGRPHDMYSELAVIIDDVRFSNEVDAIRALGGYVVFVCAGRRLTDLDAEWRKHESERLATDYTNGHSGEMFDFVLTNNSSEASFIAAVENLAPSLVGAVPNG